MPLKGQSVSEETRRKMSEAQKGKRHTAETKQKLSKIMRGIKLPLRSEEWCRNISLAKKGKKGKPHSEEWKQAMSLRRRGRKMPPRPKEWCENISKGKKGKPLSDEAKEHLSKYMAQKIALEGHHPSSKYYRNGTYYSVKNQKYLPYASSYELEAYKMLEQMPEVVAYGRCDFYVEYVLDGSKRRYIPDLVYTCQDGVREVVEIKPESLLDDRINQAKFDAANDCCAKRGMSFAVWSEGELGLINLLK